MAVTKTLRTIIAAGTSNAAAATTTGTVVDLTTALGGYLTLKITNGATAPPAVANAYVYTSGDNASFKLSQVLPGSSSNSAVAEYGLEIPFGVMYLRVDVKDNTAQAVTCEAFLQELTTA